MRDSRHGVAARTVAAPDKVIALHSLLDSGTQASVAHGIAPLEVSRPAIAEHANGWHGRRGMVVLQHKPHEPRARGRKIGHGRGHADRKHLVHDTIVFGIGLRQPRGGAWLGARRAIGRRHVATEQRGEQPHRWVVATALPGKRAREGHRCLQGHQMCHRDLVGDQRAVCVGQQIQSAGLRKRAAIRGRVRRVRQAHPRLDHASHAMQHCQRRNGHGKQQQARYQRLAALCLGLQAAF
ncbi:hypothetical protein ACOTCR_18860 [Achromobacter xylosoxidans]